MKIAVLYQSQEPPLVNGIRKPMKDGGYRDSGADLAFCLQKRGSPVALPVVQPCVEQDLDLSLIHIWRFGDIACHHIIFLASYRPLQSGSWRNAGGYSCQQLACGCGRRHADWDFPALPGWDLSYEGHPQSVPVSRSRA